MFDKLLRKPNKTLREKALCQAIALLSTCPPYDQMTPWEVYDVVVVQAREVGY